MMNRQEIDQARKKQERKYNELMATARGLRLQAEHCSSVREAMRLIISAEDFAARAYHTVA